jgi:2-polyprenyl-3-methyl-5-hydroxy-6-metoxy-1,4-benzoquinol methylase
MGENPDLTRLIASETQLPHEEVHAIQLQSLRKIVPRKDLTFARRVVLRFKSEFFGQPLKRKIWFLGRALQWRMERLGARMARNASAVFLPTLPAQSNDKILRVAVHGTGSLGDFCTHALFIQEFYRQHGPMQIDFFSHPKKVADAKFLFARARHVQNVLNMVYLPALEHRYDLIIHIRFLVKYHIVNHARVLEHSPDLLNSIGVAQGRFEPFTLYFDHHPLLDGLMARSVGLKGMNLADMVAYVGNVSIDRKTTPLVVPDLTASSCIGRWGLADKRYITVHDGFDTSFVPAGESVTKCWPIGHWNKLVADLKDEFPDIAIVQIGTVTGRKIDNVDLDLRNKTTLEEVTWIIKNSSLHIDGESGMVRLAHALHTKSAVLFGPTSKSFFSFDSNINLSSSVCGDCWWSTSDWLSQCPRELAVPECMDALTPQRVFQQVKSYLKLPIGARYEAGKLLLYNGSEGKEFLADLFATLQLTPVPISRHTENRESGIYLHASKQWEYTQAYRVVEAMSAELGRPLRIADVGGGRGALSPYLAKKGHHVEVFDLDYLWDHKGDIGVEHRFQSWAAKNGLKVSYGSLFNVPAATGAYDVVLSVSVMEHVPQKQYALKESLRLLRSGGKLILSFDFTENKGTLEDSLRVEIFTPELLNSTLATTGIEKVACSSKQIEQSALRIQRDQVAGIPPGMTVGSLTITCSHK